MSSEMKYLLEKATSPLILETDWDTTLQIVDKIRQGDITPKVAVTALLNNLEVPNPNVVISTLQVLESVVKNCGSLVHEIIATKTSMEVFYNLVHRTDNEEVKTKILMILAMWVYAFRNEPKYDAVSDAVNVLKLEGCPIPSVVESDAMFTADRAPDWADGEKCHRCRTQFSLLRRKHHCRACGQVFCSECSNRTSTIPKFGIEREVRVCISCDIEINDPNKALAITRAKLVAASEAASQKASIDADNESKKKAQALQEEEELQLALALSKSEADSKQSKKIRANNNFMNAWPNNKEVSPSESEVVAPSQQQEDPELSKYLNRNYWQEQKNKQMANETTSISSSEKYYNVACSPSAPQGTIRSKNVSKMAEAFGNTEPEDLDDFVSTLRSQLEIFVNRMQSNQSRGRPIANDSAVQSLFMNITAMHTQLLTFIHDIDNKRVRFEHLQDKISQTRDARAALEALREEHRDKLKQEREEQERIRQIQMMQKLEIMRKKKQEYLEYQRQMALHRMAESERQILSQPGPQPATHMPPGYPPMHYPGPYPSQQPMPNYMQPQPEANYQPPAQAAGYANPVMAPQPDFNLYNVQAPTQPMPPVTTYPNSGNLPSVEHLPQPAAQPPPKQEEAPLISFD